MEKYLIEIEKIRKTDDNLSIKTYKSLSLRKKLYKESWTLDKMTPADDECLFHAIIQQAQREEIHRNIPSSLLKTLLEKGDSFKLRQYIVHQMQNNQEDERLVNFRNEYRKMQEDMASTVTEPGDWKPVTWEQLCNRLMGRGEWGDENVLQAIAFLFEMDIAMITMSSKPGINQVFYKKRDNSKHSGDIDVPYLMIGNYSL